MKGNTSMRTDAFLPGAEGLKVLSGLRDDVIVKLHHYPPFQLTPNAYVQVAPPPPHISPPPVTPRRLFFLFDMETGELTPYEEK